MTKTAPVLYFDGVCNLCSAAVQFIIRHDKHQLFLFSALQSEAGQKALEHFPEAREKTGSLILAYDGKYYSRSSAALHTARLLGGGWSLFYGFIILPRFIRDAMYDFISRNRYQWFGKKDSCMIPTPELAKRFI